MAAITPAFLGSACTPWEIEGKGAGDIGAQKLADYCYSACIELLYKF